MDLNISPSHVAERNSTGVVADLTLPAVGGARRWAVGIDPGCTGAMAAVRLDLAESRVEPLPLTGGGYADTLGICDFLQALKLDGGIAYCVLEKAQVMPRQGAVSGFNYGRNYGILVACLECAGVPFIEVRPAVWKKNLVGVAPKGASDKDIKAMSFAVARRLFPSYAFRQKDDGKAEALLMAEAARRLLLTGGMGGSDEH